MEEITPMTTTTMMTMPATVERTTTGHAKPVSQIVPMLVAIVFLVVTGVASILISGPMH